MSCKLLPLGRHLMLNNPHPKQGPLCRPYDNEVTWPLSATLVTTLL